MITAMRLASIALLATIIPATARAQAASADSGWIRPSDTVRVWSQAMKVKGTRAVVTRAGLDTIAFMAPSGFRKVPREFVGDVASVQRLDVLQGRRRSGRRVLGSMALGGALGAAAGALLGVGVGTLIYESNRETYEGSKWDNRAMAQIMLGAAGAGLGGAVGLIGGGINGARAQEQWRRIR